MQKHPSVEMAAWGWNQISAIPTKKKRDKRLNIAYVSFNNMTVELERNAKRLTSKMNSSSHQKPYLSEVSSS